MDNTIMNRYSREDYDHRHCLAVTRTESGEFVKCLVCTGNADEPLEQLGPAKPIYDQVETDDEHCVLCGNMLIADSLCPCVDTPTSVRQFETGQAAIHPDDIEKGMLDA